MLAETGDEACELGIGLYSPAPPANYTEYVQKLHNFACLLGGLKDQYPGSGSGLENLLAKLGDALCEFQSYHLEFVHFTLLTRLIMCS